MDLTLMFLRLVHLFGAVIWVGATFSMVLFVSPTARALGAEAQPFMQHLTRRTGFQRWMSAASGLTVLSGLIMYYLLFEPMAPWNVGNGLALNIGALAGLAAMGVGIQVGRTTKRIGALGAEIAAAGGPPKPEQAAEMQGLQERMASLAAATAVLMVVALAGMTLSEYFAITF